MSWKTILVPLDGGGRCAECIAVAATLAARHGSHVIGVAATGFRTFGVPPEAQLYAADVYAVWGAELRRSAESLAEAFERQLREAGVTSFESRVLTDEPLDATARLGRCADLIVVGQIDRRATPSAIAWDFPEQVVLQTGTPTLVVPYTGRFSTVGSHVLVAWKETREAAIAVRAALPMLQSARQIDLLAVRERAAAVEDDARLQVVKAWLARHGIDANVHAMTTGGIAAADALLSRATDLGADCIVMGAYGHSRMREWALGGVTRSLLEHMTVPTLMAH